MPLSEVKYTCYVTERIPYFTDIYLRVIIMFGVKGVHCGKECLKDDVASNDRGVCSSESTMNNLYSH